MFGWVAEDRRIRGGVMPNIKDKKQEAIQRILGLYRAAKYGPSLCPDIERETVIKNLDKPLKWLGVSEEELNFNPYKK